MEQGTNLEYLTVPFIKIGEDTLVATKDIRRIRNDVLATYNGEYYVLTAEESTRLVEALSSVPMVVQSVYDPDHVDFEDDVVKLIRTAGLTLSEIRRYARYLRDGDHPYPSYTTAWILEGVADYVEQRHGGVKP